MRIAGAVLVGLCWLPAWTLADSGHCAQSGCSASASIHFKIVIPPPPLSTRTPSTSLKTLRPRSAASPTRADGSGQRIAADGTIHVPAREGKRISYTLVRP